MSCSLTKTRPSSHFINFTTPRSCLLRSLALAILNISYSLSFVSRRSYIFFRLCSLPLSLPFSPRAWPFCISPLISWFVRPHSTTNIPYGSLSSLL
ncbi:hypothetical protein Hanom_Chr05g00419121 [Helianthus anomalus]